MMRRFARLVAVLLSVLLGQGAARAESDAVETLLRILKEKGVLTEQEVEVVRRELAAEALTAGCPGQLPAAEKTPPAVEAVNVPPPAETAEPSFAEKDRVLATLEKAGLSGDFRLRYDFTARDPGIGSFDWLRHRGRFRLRVGLHFEPTDTVEVGFRLATGSGVANSTNQTFGEYGRPKHIFIDQAYAVWRPNRRLTFTGGRYANPFTTGFLVWDPDVSWEGAAVRWTERTERGEIYAQVGSFFLDSSSGNLAPPVMLGYQVGGRMELTSDMTLSAGLSWYDFSHLDQYGVKDLSNPDSFVAYNHLHGQQMLFDAEGRLVNRFDPLEFRVDLTAWRKSALPLTFFGHLIQNRAADLEDWLAQSVSGPAGDPELLLRYGGEDRSWGYQLGVDLGRARASRAWYGGYTYQVLEDYAFPAVFADSDFFDGYPNNRGHAFRIGYNLSENITFLNSIFLVQREDSAKDGVRRDRRWLADVLIRI